MKEKKTSLFIRIIIFLLNQLSETDKTVIRKSLQTHGLSEETILKIKQSIFEKGG